MTVITFPARHKSYTSASVFQNMRAASLIVIRQNDDVSEPRLDREQHVFLAMTDYARATREMVAQKDPVVVLSQAVEETDNLLKTCEQKLPFLLKHSSAEPGSDSWNVALAFARCYAELAATFKTLIPKTTDPTIHAHLTTLGAHMTKMMTYRANQEALQNASLPLASGAQALGAALSLIEEMKVAYDRLPRLSGIAQRVRARKPYKNAPAKPYPKFQPR